MVVSVEAGLGLNAAMMKVASELRDVQRSRSSLSSPIWKYALDANVMKRCAILLSAPALTMRSLVAMLIQTDKFGTSIAKGLRVFSDGLRTKRRQRAEQEAQKAAVKLLFPLACFLFPHFLSQSLAPLPLTSWTFWQEWTRGRGVDQ